MARVINFNPPADHITDMQRECDERAAAMNATCDAWDALGKWLIPAMAVVGCGSIVALGLITAATMQAWS